MPAIGRWSAMAAAMAVSACASGVIPQAGGRQSPSSPSHSPSRQPVDSPAPVTSNSFAVGSAQPPTLAPGAVAATSGLIAGPPIVELRLDRENAGRALAAFRSSCAALLRRTDTSGLTRSDDWRSACGIASSWSDRDAARFFEEQFEAVQVGAGTAFVTGYYEPEIAGSRTRDAAHRVPIYGPPSDIIQVDLGLFSDKLKGKSIRGRAAGNEFVPYFERGEIEDGVLTGRAPEIAWAADPVELFFLEVQGSGRLLLPGGSVMRIGYAGQNGRDYVGIGALMRDRGLLRPGQTSMQGIMAWLRANPVEGRAIMREDKSYVFFRELMGPGPLGAINVPVTPRASVAADPAFTPLGAPVWLSLDRSEASGLWVAQDTGGAIKGANRFDTFWGAGDEARRIAGGMLGRGTALILLPRGTLARLQSGAPAQP